MGLREDKKAATRAALSWAAVRLVVERGYDNVLVEDIAAAAGVSPRTFNNYFSSKGEAVAARHLDRFLIMVDNLRDRPAEEPLWDAIRAAVTGVVQPPPELPADPTAEGSRSAPTGGGRGPDRERWTSGLRAMAEHPAHQAEFLRAGARAQDALAVVIAERTRTDQNTDLYPHVTAAAVMAVTNIVMNRWWAAPDAGTARPDPGATITEQIKEALTMLSTGLPPPT